MHKESKEENGGDNGTNLRAEATVVVAYLLDECLHTNPAICQCTKTNGQSVAGGDDSPQLGQSSVATLDGFGSACGLMRHVARCHTTVQSCVFQAGDYGDGIATMQSLVVAKLVMKRDRESATVERQTGCESGDRRVGASASAHVISNPSAVEKFPGRNSKTPTPLLFESWAQLASQHSVRSA